MPAGPLSPQGNRLIRRAQHGDADDISDVTRDPRAVFSDGDILSVEPTQPAAAQSVALAGAARAPGIYDLGRASRLSDVLHGADALARTSIRCLASSAGAMRKTWRRHWSPSRRWPSCAARADQPLQDGDRVYLFSRQQIADLHRDRDLDDATRDASNIVPKKKAASLLDPDIESFLRERCAFVRGAVRG